MLVEVVTPFPESSLLHEPSPNTVFVPEGGRWLSSMTSKVTSVSDMGLRGWICWSVGLGVRWWARLDQPHSGSGDHIAIPSPGCTHRGSALSNVSVCDVSVCDTH
eukprot:6766691-Prymnesium_polylepis.2